MPDQADRQLIFVAGATGYVGGRLVPRLLSAGYRVRVLARSLDKLASRPWANAAGVEVVSCDLQDTATLTECLRGCAAAYYLVHSMLLAGSQYRSRDRDLAASFGQAAAAAGVGRILYLGGLGETEAKLSEHLSSRREVEETLAKDGVPLTVFRAAMIIGAGSASFEILRYLTERLPVMVTPRWIRTESQPVAIRNVLNYLVDALRVQETAGKTLDIGGPDILTYRDLMQIMARLLGLKNRLIFPVPVLTPRLSSLWIHLVTPVHKEIARPLTEGLRNRVVCRNDNARELLPQPLLTVDAAIAAALDCCRGQDVETRWSDAGVLPGDPAWAGGALFEDRQSIESEVPPEVLFDTVCGIGGNRGYFRTTWLWRLRGLLDRLLGGPGLRRGRRHPDQLTCGDAVDFWRVSSLEPGRRLELRAEMRLPGSASLVFEVEPLPSGSGARLTQSACFRPRGLFGLLYWYAALPLHWLVFRGLLAGIERAARLKPSGRDTVLPAGQQS